MKLHRPELRCVSVQQCIHFGIMIKCTVHNLSVAEFTDVAREVRMGTKLKDVRPSTTSGGCPCHPPGCEVEEAQQHCQESATRSESCC